MTRIEEVNSLIGISDDFSIEKNKNIIFIYCPPKVGSTTLVSSIRLNACGKYTVIHLHNELMLKILYRIHNITVLDIINYNKSLGKNVIVIDIYRSPIEQKMSTFFENIDTFHFNTPIEHLVKFDISRIIKRFNQVFPYLNTPDYFKTCYQIQYPDTFDFNNKLILTEKNGIKYYKIRLCDSGEWTQILQKILGFPIFIINDYETEKKTIQNLYRLFKQEYKIPINLFNLIEEDENLKYYYNENERIKYLNNWTNKTINTEFKTMNPNEYLMYTSIAIDNQYLSVVQQDHYLDLGCLCLYCCKKRKNILMRLSRGEKVEDRIVHEVEKTEFLKGRLDKVVQLKKNIPYIKQTMVTKKKNFTLSF